MSHIFQNFPKSAVRRALYIEMLLQLMRTLNADALLAGNIPSNSDTIIYRYTEQKLAGWLVLNIDGQSLMSQH